MADQAKEEQILQKHLRDLAEKSYRQNIYTFTGFLGLAEQDLYHQMKKEIAHVPATLFGGMEDTERVMIRFGDEDTLGYLEEFPICLLKIAPLSQKFADDLSHRDFLGALMNLGIDRSLLGDIFLRDNCGYLFASETIADFIMENLTRVKHTSVKVMRSKEQELVKEEPVPVRIVVSSQRVDGVIAKVYHLSRAESLDLFRKGLVRIGGRLCENNGGALKNGDVVAVRGYGKFIYQGVDRETKKGRESVTVLMYQNR